MELASAFVTTKILFMCPHSAAKSVAAAGFMTREAAKRGLDVEVSNGGTDPDPEVAAGVRSHLEAEGLPVVDPPSYVTAEDLEQADVAVNIGCDLSHLAVSRAVEDWVIPDFSDDVDAAFAAIKDHVGALADRLASS